MGVGNALSALSIEIGKALRRIAAAITWSCGWRQALLLLPHSFPADLSLLVLPPRSWARLGSQPLTAEAAGFQLWQWGPLAGSIPASMHDL